MGISRYPRGSVQGIEDRAAIAPDRERYLATAHATLAKFGIPAPQDAIFRTSSDGYDLIGIDVTN